MEEDDNDVRYYFGFISEVLYISCILLFLSIWHLAFLPYALLGIYMSQQLDDNSVDEHRIIHSKKYPSEPNVNGKVNYNMDSLHQCKSAPRLNATTSIISNANAESHLDNPQNEYYIEYKPLYDCCSSSEITIGLNFPNKYFETSNTQLISRFLSTSKSCDLQTSLSSTFLHYDIPKSRSCCCFTILNTTKEDSIPSELSKSLPKKSKAPPKPKRKPPPKPKRKPVPEIYTKTEPIIRKSIPTEMEPWLAEFAAKLVAVDTMVAELKNQRLQGISFFKL